MERPITHRRPVPLWLAATIAISFLAATAQAQIDLAAAALAQAVTAKLANGQTVYVKTTLRNGVPIVPPRPY